MHGGVRGLVSPAASLNPMLLINPLKTSSSNPGPLIPKYRVGYLSRDAATGYQHELADLFFVREAVVFGPAINVKNAANPQDS